MNEFFPDNTPIDEWFYDYEIPTLESKGKAYIATEYSINENSTQIQTEQFQALIDRIAAEGGGVLVIPKGVFMSGAIHFPKGVHLYLEKEGMLKGSDDIADYPVCDTRIEGESCVYFPALINADDADGFTIFGSGTIDGNGMRSWVAFRRRRMWNPACTNKDEQRARLIFISNSKNVTIAGVTIQNSQFWSCHLYRCKKVKVLECRITSPHEPVRSPSTDAIDLDVCRDVLVKNCYMNVNDDAVVLKGGKGPWADTAPENGSNERIIVEDCVYGFCHGCLTVGSESVHSKNVIVRRIQVDSGNNLLWLKLRPDTPQHYEYITVSEVKGNITNFINVNPWTQFFDLKGRTDKPLSKADHVTMEKCECNCDVMYNVKFAHDQYILENFTFSDLKVNYKDIGEARMENLE